MDLNQEVTVEPPLKQFGHYLSVGVALLVFGYLVLFSPVARRAKSQPFSRPALNSAAAAASAGQPPASGQAGHTIDQQASSASSADAHRLLAGSGREDDLPPLRILKTIVLDEAGPAKADGWTSLSIAEQESVGFPSGGADLKLIKKVPINEQTPEGSLTGRLQLFEGSHGTYLQLDLIVTPIQLSADDK